jgi:hypothetical protein
MSLELLDLNQNSGGFVFERRPLGGVVFLRIFARVIFEIQVAEILIENLFLLAEKVQTRFGPLPLDMALGVKDVSEDSDQKKTADDGAHGSIPFPLFLRLRS